MRLGALALAALPVLAGCAHLDVRHEETIVARQPLELPQERAPRLDRRFVSLTPVRDGLYVTARAELACTTLTVERQTLEVTTVRTPDPTMLRVEGATALGAAALGTYLFKKADDDCAHHDGGEEDWCGLGEAIGGVFALSVAIPAAIATTVDLLAGIDGKETVERTSEPVGTRAAPCGVAPLAGTVAVRLPDGTTASGALDASGVARVPFAPERLSALAPGAAIEISVDGVPAAVVRAGAGR